MQDFHCKARREKIKLKTCYILMQKENFDQSREIAQISCLSIVMFECIEKFPLIKASCKKMSAQREGTGIGYGKVLIAGGYLILDHENRGISLSYPNAKIETHIKLLSSIRIDNSAIQRIAISLTNETFPKHSKSYQIDIPSYSRTILDSFISVKRYLRAGYTEIASPIDI